MARSPLAFVVPLALIVVLFILVLIVRGCQRAFGKNSPEGQTIPLRPMQDTSLSGYSGGSARAGDQLPAYYPSTGTNIAVQQQISESGQYFIAQSVQRPSSAEIAAAQLDSTPIPKVMADARPNISKDNGADEHREYTV